MSFKFNFQGIDISTTSAAEAAALVRELTGQQQASKVGRPPKAPGLFETMPADEGDTPAVAIAFLSAIRNGIGDGVSADDLMKVLNVEHSKGIGGRSVRINNLLRKLKFEPEEVYTSERLPEGRFWKAATRIDEAIQTLKRGG